ncbi:MAG: hypothetical protein WCT04_23075 [Planctomycetota bacterium]
MLEDKNKAFEEACKKVFGKVDLSTPNLRRAAFDEAGELFKRGLEGMKRVRAATVAAGDPVPPEWDIEIARMDRLADSM